MKSFENTIDKKYSFSSCDICDAKCCDGARGSTFSQIILEDFKEIYENFPIVFLLGDLGFLKPVVLLTNGKSFCRYLKDFRCTIYEKRPSVCRVYPLSPHLTDVTFIDTFCPAVGDEGKVIVDNAKISSNFDHYILNDYQEKYIKMHQHFDVFNKKENLEIVANINDNIFYKFKEDLGDEYIKMHLSSLKNFDSYFSS